MNKKEKPLHIRLRLMAFFLLLAVAVFVHSEPLVREGNLETVLSEYCEHADARAVYLIDRYYNNYLKDEEMTEEDLLFQLCNTFVWSGDYSMSILYSLNRTVEAPAAYTGTLYWNGEQYRVTEERNHAAYNRFPELSYSGHTQPTGKTTSPFSENAAPGEMTGDSVGRITQTENGGYRRIGSYSRELTAKNGDTIRLSVAYAVYFYAKSLRWGMFFVNLLFFLLNELLVYAVFCLLLYKRTVRPLMEVAVGMKNGMPQLRVSPKHLSKVAERIRSYYRYSASLRQSDRAEITRLQTALEYASKAEDNRRLMTSAIAHELKTPLAVIHSHAEALQSDISAEKREHYLQVLLTETERIDETVMELLDLSRLEAGRIHLSQEDTDFQALVSEAADKFTPLAAARGLHLILTHEGSGSIHADEGRLRQAVDNFLSNAVRYCLPDGEIRICSRVYRGSTHGYIQFSVENAAEPLSSEELEKVWDTFYKTDKSRTEKGTGLGLAIARSIVHLHGGECYAENTKLGVKFSFEIKNV